MTPYYYDHLCYLCPINFENGNLLSGKSWVSLPLSAPCESMGHTTYSRNIMCQKFESICGFWVPNGSHDFFFYIFSIYFFNYYGSYPENTNAPSFLTHNISAVGGVGSKSLNLEQVQMVNICHCDSKLGREDRSF